jgi:hypothetical protein
MNKATTVNETDLAPTPRAFGNRPSTIWQLALRRLAPHLRGWAGQEESAAARHSVYIGL